jgi:hypothetical protein
MILGGFSLQNDFGGFCPKSNEPKFAQKNRQETTDLQPLHPKFVHTAQALHECWARVRKREGRLLLRRLRFPSRAALRAMVEGEEAMMAATLDARFWLGFASAPCVGFWEGTEGGRSSAKGTEQGRRDEVAPTSTFLDLQKL